MGKAKGKGKIRKDHKQHGSSNGSGSGRGRRNSNGSRTRTSTGAYTSSNDVDTSIDDNTKDNGTTNTGSGGTRTKGDNENAATGVLGLGLCAWVWAWIFEWTSWAWECLEMLDDVDLLIICRNCAWLIFAHYYLLVAYKIRLIAIHEFGTIIHEYDPYFNYRAAEYLYEHGWRNFFTWYDYKVWYPIGRPVGTTIYPGMQFLAVFLKKYVPWIRDTMSLNDVCCYIPAWFGVISTFLTGLIAYECTLEQNCPTTLFHVVRDLVDLGRGGGGSRSSSSRGRTRGRRCYKKKRRRKNQHHHHQQQQHHHLSTPSSTKGENTGNSLGKLFDAHSHTHQHTEGYEIKADSTGSIMSTSTIGDDLESVPESDDYYYVYGYETNQHESNNNHNNSSNNKVPTVMDYNPAVECGIFSMGIMAMVPAHLMRSVGGGFDNESVAISAMLLTFYFWVRSLRANDDRSHLYGILTGLAYFLMGSTWGGHIFVLNLIALHAVILVLMGRFTTKVYLSYTLFFIVGTSMVMKIPVIGWSPLKSLEQIGALVVFICYQLLYACESTIKWRKLKSRKDAWEHRFLTLTCATVTGISAIAFTVPSSGYFTPIPARIMGLFYKCAKTGNPLVDSVAEHQPADGYAYFRYLQHLCTAGPIGFIITIMNFGDSPSFLIVYAIAATILSHRMIRLILLMAPIASILGGITVGRIVSWVFCEICHDEYDFFFEDGNDAVPADDSRSVKSAAHAVAKKNKKGNKRKGPKTAVERGNGSNATLIIRSVLAFLMLGVVMLFSSSFQNYCLKTSRVLSNPVITQLAQSINGKIVKIDDYRESYAWLRENTNEDVRILSWWDYGYQITALSNRTTIADGNTWNHEHIALLGKILTANETEGYAIARHLADYILISAGGGGDDLAKSPHIARIASSVYRSVCPGDITCRNFRFVDNKKTPSKMMRESLLYTLHSHDQEGDIKANKRFFKEVYRSRYGKVRIFEILQVDKKSKAWVADAKNRICDVEGGWQCRGRYPPALKKVLEEKRDFQQPHEFANEKDDGYQMQYFEDIFNTPRPIKMDVDRPIHHPNGLNRKVEPELGIKYAVDDWVDTEETTKMWKIITSGNVEDLEKFLEERPMRASIRSSDGRGPMFWAFEYRRHDMVQLLTKYGVGHNEKDNNGLTPVDLLDSQH